VKQLALTALLFMILVYFFAIIGFIWFPQDFV
jgi:hypothetical protein